MKLAFASFLAGVLLQGCAERMVLTPSPRRLAGIEKGMTRSTVLNLLGFPNDVEKGQSPDGEPVWVWTYAEGIEAQSLDLPGENRPRATNTPGAYGLRITWTSNGFVADTQPFGTLR